MIARVAGTVAAHSLDRVEILTSGGVTYEVVVPLGVLESLPRAGGALSLHTAMVVREDAWTLYGFPTAEERKLFQRLMGTTGVGPALAMNLLSTLTRVPRVGKKLAERLVLELRDKLEGALGDSPSTGVRSAMPSGPGADAVRALQALGYSPVDAERAVRAALEHAPKGETTPDLVRRSLAALAK